jgi:glycosyltransferase involved in cell wall biosynthesis
VPGATGGLEVYARGLIPALAELEPAIAMTVIASETAARDFADFQTAPVRVDARSKVRAALAEQVALPRAVRRIRPDLVHNLFNTAPAFSGAPQVTTIHDLIHRTVPETHAGALGLGLRLLVDLATKRSRRIIAVSEATKREIVSRLGVDADLVDVVPNGPGLIATAPLPEEDVRRALSLGDRPVVLAVSAKRPHKNLERLITAMASVDDAVLVLPGYPTPFEPQLRDLAERTSVADRVRLTGWVDDQLLEGLYASARCLVVPSLAEGFGLPVLEAMARGTPVACSGIPPFREVAGDAALFFDPLDVQSIVETIASLVADGELRQRLAAAGRERALRFSWERSAQATAATYERALA